MAKNGITEAFKMFNTRLSVYGRNLSFVSDLCTRIQYQDGLSKTFLFELFYHHLERERNDLCERRCAKRSDSVNHKTVIEYNNSKKVDTNTVW